MSDIPIESRSKYGDWDGDIDEFGDLLLGREPMRTKRIPRVSDESPLDEAICREAANSSDKYGR